MSTPQPDLRPKEIQTRFLYPFFFDRGKASQASDELSGETIPARGGLPIAIWECAEPPALYREELLDHVDNFLFQTTARGCRYLRVSSPASSRWFNKLQAVLIEPRPARESITWPISLVPLAGIEVFLTNYGAGVLSISLSPDQVELSFENAILFNYKLAQLRPQVSARLHIPHPSENQKAWEHMSQQQKDEVGSPPSAHAPVIERLGVAGGSFLLGEFVVAVLLRPLGSLGLEPVQTQFSVYTVVRFGEEVDFEKPEITGKLATFLSGISQIEEPTHAGSPARVVGVTHAILNRRHIAAVGLLGMAQMVSDQPTPDLSFNAQRVPRVIGKYFIPYLVALFQRISLQRALSEASDLVLNQSREMQAEFSKLRRHLIEFAVEGYFPETSHREVLDRYYRMAQEGLGVRRAYQDVSRSIADIDAQFAADHQAKLAEAMAENVAATRNLQEDTAKVQHKLGLLEHFVISVYAATLWEMLASHIDQLDRWIPHGVIVFAILGFVGTWGFEKLWDKKHISNK